MAVFTSGEGGVDIAQWDEADRARKETRETDSR